VVTERALILSIEYDFTTQYSFVNAPQ
jgi:hypothetical protein